MTFASPFLLALVPLAAAAAFSAWRRVEGRRAAFSYPGVRGLGPSADWVRLAPYVLKGTALVLCAAALARPQSVRRAAAEADRGIDILMAIDTSVSMRALDFAPMDRMGAAKQAAADFIRGRVSDRIGVVVFGGVPMLSCPLTSDYGALLEFLSALYPGMTQSDGTAIGDGIAAAVNHLKDGPSKSKVVILLTDGRNNAGLVDPMTAARAAKAYGIRIHAVGTARKGEAFFPVDDPVFGRRLMRMPDDLDEGLLSQVAHETGGRYFRAESPEQLASVYAEIDRMEKTEFKRPPAVSYADLHPWLLWPAALLLAAHILLSRTVLARIP